jgi:16S rRNA (cytidine1402-2'-O)-methyltransferase
MVNKGNVYLIPCSISDNTSDAITTPYLKAVLPEIRYFLAENVRTARRYLSSLRIYESIESLSFEVLDKDTGVNALPEMFKPLMQGNHLGIISESGCPGVADPGALAVRYAHENDIRVIPLIGPSSILLALMSSGLNGQRFAFHGYLPVDAKDSGHAIRNFEKESKLKNQTQIFIETPYRNNAVYQHLCKNLLPGTLMTIAIDITGTGEYIRTKTIEQWRLMEFVLPKSPAVFLFLAV